mmetsp:Transcript_80199/g.159404  ORF Transcript_80199/g.159404 Transcript_80199/m.159404 type:complete len:229 (-) Transcript_80199:2062-2748(-)
MPRYSAYSSTSETAHLKSYCAQTSSLVGSCPVFQPMSDTTATFIISESAAVPSATSCWKFCSLEANWSCAPAVSPTSMSLALRSMPAVSSCAAGLAALASSSALAASFASSSAFLRSASSRFFLAVLRSNESWRARRKRSCRSFSSASLAFASASAFLRSSSSRARRSSSSLRRRSSSALRAASSSSRFLRSAASLSSRSFFFAMTIRATCCIATAFMARYSMRTCSS